MRCEGGNVRGDQPGRVVAVFLLLLGVAIAWHREHSYAPMQK